MPSAQDHVNVKPGGLGEAVLGNRLQIVEFPEMRHGWTIRDHSYKTSTERGGISETDMVESQVNDMA